MPAWVGRWRKGLLALAGGAEIAIVQFAPLLHGDAQRYATLAGLALVALVPAVRNELSADDLAALRGAGASAINSWMNQHMNRGNTFTNVTAQRPNLPGAPEQSTGRDDEGTAIYFGGADGP